LEQLVKSAPVEVKSEAVELVKEFADVFAVDDLDLEKVSETEHHIDTGDSLSKRSGRSFRQNAEGRSYRAIFFRLGVSASSG
jgi:hypothetical protein